MSDEPDKLEEFEEDEIPAERTTPREQATISEIPIRVQLEVSRFDVSLEELAKMEPGYHLPIDINPRIVHLVAGGKRIGKGEIIEVGDAIGVKILELDK